MRASPEIGWNLLALAAGAAFPLALAPFDLWWLALAVVAIFCALLEQPGPGRCTIRAFYFGLGLYATGASWIYVSIHVYGYAPPWLAFLLTALFVLFLAALFALPFALYGLLDRRRPYAVLVAFPALWVLGEWLRGWILTGFPWLYLGYAGSDTWLAGWAPVLGVTGLSALLAFSAAVVARLPRETSQPGTSASALIVAALIWLAGWQLQTVPWTRPAGETLSVALVQPAQPLERKWDRGATDAILDNLVSQSADLWHNDLVVWPESAIPRLSDQVNGFLRQVDRTARAADSALLLGIPHRQPGRPDIYNAVMGLGEADGLYFKRHLVPFGEYVPLEQWLRGTIRFFDLPMSAFSSGPDRQPLLSAKGRPIATAICYEIVYPNLVAKDAGRAQMLLTVSNDTWFGDSIGPHQHFQMARMRALENGKPLIRATNDGISALVDAKGRVTARAPQFEKTTLTGEIRPHTGKTPFSRYGTLPVLACALAFFVFALIFLRRRRTDELVLPPQ